MPRVVLASEVRPPVRQILRDRHMSLKQVGAIWGITEYHAGLYVNGNRRTPRDRAESLARVLGLPFSTCWRESDMTRPSGFPGHFRNGE